MILNRLVHRARQAVSRLFSSSRFSNVRSPNEELDFCRFYKARDVRTPLHPNMRLLTIMTETKSVTAIIGNSEDYFYDFETVGWFELPEDIENWDSAMNESKSFWDWAPKKRDSFIRAVLSMDEHWADFVKIEPLAEGVPFELPKSNGINIYVDGRQETIQPVCASSNPKKSGFFKSITKAIRRMRGSRKSEVESVIAFEEEDNSIASSSKSSTNESKQPMGEDVGVGDGTDHNVKDGKEDEIVVDGEKKT